MVLVVVCAQTSIIICYFHLRSEDYRWWWRSFFSTGTRPFSLPPLPPHSYWWVQAFLQSVSPSLSSFLLVGLISMVERNCNKRCPYYRGVLISGVSLERGVPLYTFSSSSSSSSSRHHGPLPLLVLSPLLCVQDDHHRLAVLLRLLWIHVHHGLSLLDTLW